MVKFLHPFLMNEPLFLRCFVLIIAWILAVSVSVNSQLAGAIYNAGWVAIIVILSIVRLRFWWKYRNDPKKRDRYLLSVCGHDDGESAPAGSTRWGLRHSAANQPNGASLFLSGGWGSEHGFLFIVGHISKGYTLPALIALYRSSFMIICRT